MHIVLSYDMPTWMRHHFALAGATEQMTYHNVPWGDVRPSVLRSYGRARQDNQMAGRLVHVLRVAHRMHANRHSRYRIRADSGHGELG